MVLLQPTPILPEGHIQGARCNGTDSMPSGLNLQPRVEWAGTGTRDARRTQPCGDGQGCRIRPARTCRNRAPKSNHRNLIPRRPDGSFLPFASPDEVPGRMARFLQDLNANLHIPQTAIAALPAAQQRAFVTIHPFDDGNGRMARLLLNFTVQARGFPALVIEEKAREVYMDALRLADSGDLGPLRDLLAPRLQRALAFGIAVKQQECEPGWRNATGDPAMPPAGSVYDAEGSHTITGT